MQWACGTYSCTLLTIICSTVIAAGHDASAKTLAWYFYAIAKHPEVQTCIREEIAPVRVRATGEEFGIPDLNSMVYTLATLKVVFGFGFLCPSDL